ncbi:DUF642 domain-containing protein [Tropicibacter sp. S64]|uniref:DUF642 domain-containing protein n=1 Tax=Tropicibacter sp. S64 TaxID=3415122 RepID=UPI003C7CD0FA
MKIILAAVAAFMTANAAQALPVIVNAGFEDPAYSGTFSIPSQGALPGWSVIAGNVETVDAWTASEGVRSLDLNGVNPGAISQAISGFDVGASYRLLFDMGGNFFQGATSQTASVTIGGTTQSFTYVKKATDTSTSFDWDTMTLDFIATGTSQTLTFSQVSFSPAAGAALDNIRIEALSAVPLPATLPMLLAGLGAFGLARRRKQG